MSQAHDFVVIGGGPAGSAIAILLAQAGARVALVEKDDYRAFRIGEHLPPAVRGALKTLGCERAALAGWAIGTPGIAAQWKNGARTFRPYFNRRGLPGLNVMRNAFDAVLFERAAQAGAVTYAGISGLTLTGCNPGWLVSFEHTVHHSELRARVLIDASGRRSVVARRLGSRWEHCGTMKAVAMLLPQASDGPDEDQSLAVESVPGGWLSLTPRIEGSVLTLYTAAKLGRSAAGALVREALHASSLIRSRTSGNPAAMVYAGTWPAFPSRLVMPYGHGWFAVGEAAAAYDPISGHGVVFALETAFRASEMALSDSPLHVLGPIYRDAIASRYEDHLRRREEIYREAADQFPGAPFWSQYANSKDVARPADRVGATGEVTPH